MSSPELDATGHHRAAADPCGASPVRVGLYQRRPKPHEHELLQSYIASQPGWHIRLHCTDHASGATLRRPGLQQLLTAARSGEIDVVLVSHLYNLSRTPWDLARLLEQLRSHGVRVVSAADPSADTDTEAGFGSLLVAALAAVADIERNGELDDRRLSRRPTQSTQDSLRRTAATPATQPADGDRASHATVQPHATTTRLS